jgi:hypothetical protein
LIKVDWLAACTALRVVGTVFVIFYRRRHTICIVIQPMGSKGRYLKMCHKTADQHATNIIKPTLSDSYPAFFLPIATTSNKNFFFESVATVNEKCRCCEFRGKGNKTGVAMLVISLSLLHKTRDTPNRVNREVSKILRYE